MHRYNQSISKVAPYLLNPIRIIRRINSFLFKIKLRKAANSPFYLQSQMDINPLSNWHNQNFISETGGYRIPGDNIERTIASLETWDTVRRDMILLLVRSIIQRSIEGEFAELGVYRGSTAHLIHHYAPERILNLFDTFSGFDERDTDEKKNTEMDKWKHQFRDTNIDLVMNNIKPKNKNVHVYTGFFPETIPDTLKNTTFAFVHLDADLYDPILSGLQFFYERMATGGFILVHDYNAWVGARNAVDQFLESKKEIAVPMPDKCGSALIVKS